MLTRLLIAFMTPLCIGANAQMHDARVQKINSIEEAKVYASHYSEVSVCLVNSEKDVLLFDNVDVSNLVASIGQTNTIFRRSTKFLKDTTIVMLNIQVIQFDDTKLSKDSIQKLSTAIIQKYSSGTSYWNLMKEFRTETCTFDGGPMATYELKNRYNNTFEDRHRDDVFAWKYGGKPIVIIVHEEAHHVPAFHAISYNSGGR